MHRALISVSDKTGLPELARALVQAGYQLISTGGTAQLLQKEGIAVTQVAEVTGFPEILDERVKTLNGAARRAHGLRLRRLLQRGLPEGLRAPHPRRPPGRRPALPPIYPGH